MKRMQYITPALGNVVRVEDKVYKCVRSRFPAMCDGCAFLEKYSDMATTCEAPENLQCRDNIFVEVPENSVELLPQKKKVNANPFLIVATLFFWTALFFLIKIIFKQ